MSEPEPEHLSGVSDSTHLAATSSSTTVSTPRTIDYVKIIAARRGSYLKTKHDTIASNHVKEETRQEVILQSIAVIDRNEEIRDKVILKRKIRQKVEEINRVESRKDLIKKWKLKTKNSPYNIDQEAEFLRNNRAFKLRVMKEIQQYRAKPRGTTMRPKSNIGISTKLILSQSEPRLINCMSVNDLRKEKRALDAEEKKLQSMLALSTGVKPLTREERIRAEAANRARIDRKMDERRNMFKTSLQAILTAEMEALKYKHGIRAKKDFVL